MKLRDFLVSIGCCAAALGLCSGKPLKAAGLDSASEASQSNLDCAGPEPAAANCERIGGHLRVEFSERIPDVAPGVRSGASPVAVRSDGTPQSSRRIYLPGGHGGFDPFRR
jgi:hypothetical protein